MRVMFTATISIWPAPATVPTRNSRESPGRKKPTSSPVSANTTANRSAYPTQLVNNGVSRTISLSGLATVRTDRLGESFRNAVGRAQPFNSAVTGEFGRGDNLEPHRFRGLLQIAVVGLDHGRQVVSFLFHQAHGFLLKQRRADLALRLFEGGRMGREHVGDHGDDHAVTGRGDGLRNFALLERSDRILKIPVDTDLGNRIARAGFIHAHHGEPVLGGDLLDLLRSLLQGGD